MFDSLYSIDALEGCVPETVREEVDAAGKNDPRVVERLEAGHESDVSSGEELCRVDVVLGSLALARLGRVSLSRTLEDLDRERATADDAVSDSPIQDRRSTAGVL